MELKDPEIPKKGDIVNYIKRLYFYREKNTGKSLNWCFTELAFQRVFKCTLTLQLGEHRLRGQGARSLSQNCRASTCRGPAVRGPTGGAPTQPCGPGSDPPLLCPMGNKGISTQSFPLVTAQTWSHQRPPMWAGSVLWHWYRATGTEQW